MRTDRERYWIYVVELRPKRGSASGTAREVYVGSSAFLPEVRLQKHYADALGASRHVRDRGVRLLPHLYDRLNPVVGRERAKRVEQQLADSLHARGYRVYGACKPPACFI